VSLRQIVALGLCLLALMASVLVRRNRQRRRGLRLPPPSAAATRTGYRDYKRHDIH
jgi:hypothetical protein